MESTVEVSMDDTVTVPSVAEEEAIGSLSCDADSVSFAVRDVMKLLPDRIDCRFK